MYKRNLRLPEKPTKSFFLWGTRQTGKTTLLKACYPDAMRIDLLKTDELMRYAKKPSLLREEVAALSDKLTLEVYDFVKDAEKTLQYGIDKIPATVVEGDKDYGIRYFGVPSGYEFSTLLGSIQEVSAKESGLSDKTKELVRNIHTPMHIQVFVTPT